MKIVITTKPQAFPAGSTGIYSFSNPGNSSATCIFAMWWEELPVK